MFAIACRSILCISNVTASSVGFLLGVYLASTARSGGGDADIVERDSLSAIGLRKLLGLSAVFFGVLSCTSCT